MDYNLNILLQKITIELADYLKNVLPNLEQNWWQETVIENLSYHQKNLVESHNIDSLKGLDLAALLRVLDRNWYNLSQKNNLTTEDRNFAKEMQSIRNRWAHVNSKGISLDDVYRDVDTIQRFATTINASTGIHNEIQKRKEEIISYQLSASSIDNFEKQIEAKNETDSKLKFSHGQIVHLKSDPNKRGAVVTSTVAEPENRYSIFIDGKTQNFYESQLKSEESEEGTFEFLPSEKFHSYLTALQIRFPGLSTLYSLNAARIDFIPYQFRPVLKFIRSDRPRLLIADGVGVGKTIEAGLILRELQARREIQSVLIICPRPLVSEKKWQTEMKRFDEHFKHLDGGNLRYCINEMDLEGFWPEEYDKAIIPYSLFDENRLYGQKNKTGLLDLDPPPRFDLVIVDEAHHIRNQDTYRHKAVKYFCDHAEAVVFLTATPIQLGNQDLFVLLNSLRPDLIIDQDSFEHMAEPNPYINQAINFARANDSDWRVNSLNELRQAENTDWGQSILKENPEFNQVKDKLAKKTKIEADERIDLVRKLEDLHTFSGIINRTRRRDIGDFTVRKPETINVNFTPQQRQLYDDILRIQADIFSRIHGHQNVKFMMTTIRRQAASSLYGLIPFLEDILTRHLDELTWAEADSTEIAPTEDSVDLVEDRIEEILERAKKINSEDPKLQHLLSIIRDKQRLPNNKLMVFSSFRHTLSYIYENLVNEGFRVGMIHGGVSDEDRLHLRNKFKLAKDNDDALDILLFSEIGSEGLDYQFCDCIVNFDLPWNPMRVEQRIGRIDRRGQKSETVAIFNLITPGTVDADIYERCLLRIGVFNEALGGSEEILGEINQGIRDIAENFELTEYERQNKLQQLADNKIRHIQEQEALEEKQLELFGIRLPEEHMKQEIAEASSYWLSPYSIFRLVDHYIKSRCGQEQEYILGEKDIKTLRLSQEARSILQKDFQKLPRQRNQTYREWENWLKGGSQHLQITFDAKCASENQEIPYIMPLHPLVKQAAFKFKHENKIVTSFHVNTSRIPRGSYNFAIYKWQFHGLKKDMLLQPVAKTKRITDQILDLIKDAKKGSEEEVKDINGNIWENLDEQHYQLWKEAQDNHRKKIKKQVKYRRESLEKSHEARISLLKEQLRNSSDEKIQRMRQSQINSAEEDYVKRIQELEIAIERADLTSEPVAYGVIYAN